MCFAAKVRQQISRFKEYYDLIQYSEYYRLQAPSDRQCTVWEMADPEGDEALVSAVYYHVEGNTAPVIVKVQGLNAEASYQLHLNMEDVADLPKQAGEKVNKHYQKIPSFLPGAFPILHRSNSILFFKNILKIGLAGKAEVAAYLCQTFITVG